MKRTPQSDDNDRHWVKQLRQGDESAFRRLVEKYKDVSFTLAVSILRDEVEAEDVLQDAFLKVHKHINSFRFDSSFATWLYRIVVNTALQARERHKKIQHEELARVEEEESEENLILDKITEQDRSEYIAAAFRLMKPQEALLLRLYYLGELSINEIQAVTGYSESNIKVVLHRARKNMHALLKKLIGNEQNDLL